MLQPKRPTGLIGSRLDHVIGQVARRRPRGVRDRIIERCLDQSSVMDGPGAPGSSRQAHECAGARRGASRTFESVEHRSGDLHDEIIGRKIQRRRAQQRVSERQSAAEAPDRPDRLQLFHVPVLAGKQITVFGAVPQDPVLGERNHDRCSQRLLRQCGKPGPPGDLDRDRAGRRCR